MFHSVKPMSWCEEEEEDDGNTSSVKSEKNTCQVGPDPEFSILGTEQAQESLTHCWWLWHWFNDNLMDLVPALLLLLLVVSSFMVLMFSSVFVVSSFVILVSFLMVVVFMMVLVMMMMSHT